MDLLLPAIYGTWLFVLGGAIGSFLNVVVYRVPRGMSLIRPGSHCPACNRPIRARDNLPVLGWLLLGGRCRDCKARISLRYPLVEAITGSAFVLVGLADGFFQAMIPRDCLGDTIGSRPGLFAMEPADAGFLVAFHLVLLCTLLASGLIEYDGHRLPLGVAAPAIVAGAAAPLAWPSLHPAWACFGWSGWSGALAGEAAGLTVGALSGVAVWLAVGPRDRRGLLVGPACVGLFLGWQAAAVLGLAIVVGHSAAKALGRRWPAIEKLSPNLLLAAAVVAWLFTWEDIVRGVFWWGIL